MGKAIQLPVKLPKGCKWVVLDPNPITRGKHRCLWCRCPCGEIAQPTIRNLLAGRSRMCPSCSRRRRRKPGQKMEKCLICQTTLTPGGSWCDSCIKLGRDIHAALKPKSAPTEATLAAERYDALVRRGRRVA